MKKKSAKSETAPKRKKPANKVETAKKPAVKAKAGTKKVTQKNIEKIIKDLISRGTDNGFVTRKEIRDIFPGEPSQKVLSALYNFLSDKGIDVKEPAKKASRGKKKESASSVDEVIDTKATGKQAPTDENDIAEAQAEEKITKEINKDSFIDLDPVDDATKKGKVSKGGKAAAKATEVKATVAEQVSDDPVRMYLREMGSIKLLTREGEVEIAKMIEKGQHEMLDILLRSELIVNYLFDLGKKIEEWQSKSP